MIGLLLMCIPYFKEYRMKSGVIASVDMMTVTGKFCVHPDIWNNAFKKACRFSLGWDEWISAKMCSLINGRDSPYRFPAYYIASAHIFRSDLLSKCLYEYSTLQYTQCQANSVIHRIFLKSFSKASSLSSFCPYWFDILQSQSREQQTN